MRQVFPAATSMLVVSANLGGAYLFVRAASATQWHRIGGGFVPVALLPTEFTAVKTCRRSVLRMRHDTVVVGAGPAGLAVAATLHDCGVPCTVLEQGDGVGTAWRARYDSLHLHTARWLSSLPLGRIPRKFGPWVSRDDFVTFLGDYAAQHGVRPEFGVTLERIDRDTELGAHAVLGGVVAQEGHEIVARHPRTEFPGDASAGKAGEPAGGVQMQAVVACPPRGADAVALVQHRARHPTLLKRRGDSQTGRPRADDQGVGRHSEHTTPGRTVAPSARTAAPMRSPARGNPR